MKQLIRSYRFWLFLAVAGLAFQFIINIFFVYTWFDEANYAYKGYIAVKGIYPMYGENGPWFEYMPLSFLIPGVIQALFGPNFIIGRIFTIICASLAIFLSYRLALKLHGKLASLITILLILVSVVTLRYYSTITPYAWVSLFLILSFSSLASDIRSPYREILAVFFITVSFATRQNMVLTWASIVLFSIITQKRFFYAFLVAIFSVLSLSVFILPFWPGIANEILTGFPYLNKILYKTLDIPHYSIKAMYNPWSIESFLEGVRWTIKYTFPILAASIVALFWGIRNWYSENRMLFFAQKNRLIILAGFLFFSNFIFHFIIPQSYCPKCPALYFNYFSPLGAVIAGIGISDMIEKMRLKKIKIAILSLLILSIFFISSATNVKTFKIWPPRFHELQKTAARISFLTTPEDKIFSLSDMHLFLLAKRYPYPALMNHQLGYVLSDDTDKVLRRNKWNYELAERWLSEADVVVLTERRITRLKEVYPGHTHSGANLVKFINKTVRDNFVLLEEVPSLHECMVRIYRRKS